MVSVIAGLLRAEENKCKMASLIPQQTRELGKRYIYRKYLKN